ncbi:hypothetical protein AB0J27_20440 [Micromonospora chokoriensis]
MTDTTTAAKLTAGARILVIFDADVLPSPAKVSEGATVAEVQGTMKVARKISVLTNLGTFEVGGTAKVLLAPADDTAEDVAHREKFDDTAEAAEEPAPTGDSHAHDEIECGCELTPADGEGVESTGALVEDEDEEPEAPAPIIATVTTDDAGRLTHFSKLRVAVDGTMTERPVPWKVDAPAGAVAPVRLAFVLREMGYAPAGRWEAGAANEAACVVVPLPEDE